MHSHSVHSQDVSIAYRVIGAGPRDVMLVHGWMVSGAVYDDLVGPWIPRDCATILVDLRGSGKSGRPQSGYTMSSMPGCLGGRRCCREPQVHAGRSQHGRTDCAVDCGDGPERVLGMVLCVPCRFQGFRCRPMQALFRNCGQNRSMQQTILGLACKQLSG